MDVNCKYCSSFIWKFEDFTSIFTVESFDEILLKYLHFLVDFEHTEIVMGLFLEMQLNLRDKFMESPIL